MLPQSHPTLQKGMRKGTRSCYECRKRKVRCIFTKESEICGNCELKARRCTEQRRELIQAGNVDTRESLREKIKRLEAVIEDYGRKSSSTAPDEVNRSLNIDLGDVREENLSSESTPSELGAKRTPASTPSSLETPASVDETSSQDIDPIVTLFHNAIWRSHSSDLIPERISKLDKAENPATAKKHIRTRELLLSGLIPPALREIVVNATCSWWYTWRPLGSMLQSSTGDVNSTLPDFILWALESPDPSIIGIAILCIAVCLQQLDTRIHQYIIRQLPSLPGTLFQEYFEKVERLIVNDGDYASTKEGIEAIVFAAKIYMNLGLNRKCWILTHQAISYSQLLNLHRPHLSTDKNSLERNQRIQSWLSLCAGDVYLSLLLGLPYAADGRTIPTTHNQENPTAQFHHNLIILSSKVIDRNQRGLHLSIPHTQKIQTSLHTITQTLPTAFWDPQTTLSQNKISRPEYLEQIAAQCWYYHLLVLLHMPLMLQSILDPTLENHRTQCLSAARNLLRIWHIMRSDMHSAFEMVKLIDYQAFVCSTLLILSMLGYGSCENGGRDEDKNENEHHDRELLARTIAMLAQAGDSLGNLVAKQAVQGLESLLQMGRGNCPRKQGGKMGEGEDFSMGSPYAKIVVPYVGVITISPGEYYENIEAAVDVVTGMQTEMHTQNQTQTQNQSTPFSFSLESNPNPNHDQDQYHEALRNGDASNHHNTNTRYEEPGTSGEAREVPGDTQGQRQIQMEWTSIDFDWASNLTAGFEDDWAWLNGLGG
ncbi:hypothetical protein BELL_1035g00010 [Botrytis elliptica]|uniref:Zn(2)-C6 fungal-type domain-containing protein n=1 Tax=Botrytis elliptica TaxID=278938 RepID=A0A4Z1IT65_9HELO|nr:hypothetical protein EAE99_005767 [Botrytis elliptica]TGO64555.1 hypothetical protein BELL_1035g00010 [Botrytis elliptica]